VQYERGRYLCLNGSRLLAARGGFQRFYATAKQASEAEILNGLRFLGRRLHFAMSDYLDMPFNTFKDVLLDEVEAMKLGTKPKI